MASGEVNASRRNNQNSETAHRHNDELPPRRQSTPSLSTNPIWPNTDDRNTERPTLNNVSSCPFTVVYSQISDPPTFDDTKYECWKKELQLRHEINAGTDQNRLLATVGIRANGSLKIAMREYFGRAKGRGNTRSLGEFAILMDGKFRRPTEELILQRVEQWSEMERKPSEGFKAYWVKMERLHRKLTDLEIVWPEKVAFQKASTALCMSKEQQTLIRAAMEMVHNKDSIIELRRMTIKLFDNQIQELGDVCHAQEDTPLWESEEDHSTEYQEWELSQSKGKPSKNRGGFLSKSIRSTHGLYGGKGGKKGGFKPDADSKCRNCDQTGHWWRNFPNLLEKPVISAKAKMVFGKVVRNRRRRLEKG